MLGGNPDGWDLRASGTWGGGTMGATDEQAFTGSQAFRVEGNTMSADVARLSGRHLGVRDGALGPDARADEPARRLAQRWG